MSASRYLNHDLPQQEAGLLITWLLQKLEDQNTRNFNLTCRVWNSVSDRDNAGGNNRMGRATHWQRKGCVVRNNVRCTLHYDTGKYPVASKCYFWKSCLLFLTVSSLCQCHCMEWKKRRSPAATLQSGNTVHTRTHSALFNAHLNFPTQHSADSNRAVICDTQGIAKYLSTSCYQWVFQHISLVWITWFIITPVLHKSIFDFSCLLELWC